MGVAAQEGKRKKKWGGRGEGGVREAWRRIGTGEPADLIRSDLAYRNCAPDTCSPNMGQGAAGQSAAKQTPPPFFNNSRI